MPQAQKTKNLTEKDLVKYKEVAKVYAQIYKELELLEVEGKELKRKVKEIIDKVKTKNILEDIINKPQ